MTYLRITGPNSDGEYWLHIKAGGKMGGFNLGSEHGPLAHRLLDAAAIEAPAPDPVAWRWRICYREEWCWSVTKPMFSPRDLEQGTVFDVQPLYTTPPDHLALVAAAYRDAADKCGAHSYSNNYFVSKALHDASTAILARTPADAEAHLTAIERAAYERGVQSALQHIRTWMELEAEDRGEADAEYPLERQCAPILALLTQEGR